MPSDPKTKILLVDDRPANLLALEAVLGDMGLDIVKAESGQEALRCLLKDDFALILMDAQMPGMDGFETAELIRVRERSRYTPIIFLTAVYRTDVEMQRGYSVGAVDYLFKPLVPEVLRSKVAIFVELFEKTEQLKRQAELLRENQRREHERQLAEEKQRWEVERLREEGRRKDEFLAVLGHELRNPLSPILNALHIIRLHGTAEATVRQALDMAERQARHMARLVDDLLDVSRISRGKIELRKEPVELAAVVNRVVESFGPVMEARAHQLDVLLPPEPVWLEADATRLEQILANLLNNAAKFTEPGGRICLTGECEGDEVVLHVRDNGIGIAQDMLEHVFDLFAQADHSSSKSAQWGLGIGLALVRSLAELHGGSVQAHSDGLGRGSEFMVRLPALPKPPPDSFEPAAKKNSNGRLLRVLVVDDHKDAAESLAMMLRLKGHDVRLAYDGATALETARSYRPEVILLDIALPGMNGHELAQRLREEPGMKRTLLVATTGFGQEKDRLRSQDAGFDCHLVKPVDPQELQEVLSRCEATTS